jgi:hypothetical protein
MALLIRGPLARAAIIASTVLGAAIVAVPGNAAAQASSYAQTYLAAPHNWAFRNRFPQVDALFNAFDYGHAILYETLWRQPAAPASALDVDRFDFITRKLLRNPPKVALDESAIGPNWVKLAPEVAQMFEWAHLFHRQLYDIWSDDRLNPAQKDAQVARVLRYYQSRGDLAFSAKPKSMNLMEGQAYSLAFRKRFPKYNGLIWSYHWLQMTLYEALMAAPNPAERRDNVNAVVARFWTLLDGGADSLPTVMPMSAAIAPRFSARYPEAAVVFDNLHSLHDVVSDILADPTIPARRKRDVILVAASRYRDETSSVTTMDEWRAMADAMGIAKMGGPAPIRISDER